MIQCGKPRPWSSPFASRDNPSTPVVGSVYDAGTDLYYPIFGAHGGARDPAFSQLDLRVDKSFEIGAGRLGLYLDVQNVYAAENPEGYTYSYDYREREATTRPTCESANLIIARSCGRSALRIGELTSWWTGVATSISAGNSISLW